MEATQVIIRPVVSEKSYVLSAADRYTFRVHPDAHKTQIRQAVQELFTVKVVKDNTLNVRGKFRRQRTAQAGQAPNWKKALITLKEGDKISLT